MENRWGTHHIGHRQKDGNNNNNQRDIEDGISSNIDLVGDPEGEKKE